MTRTKGVILILISTLMFGSYGVWSKLIGDSFGNFYQGWTRALIIVIVLLPFLIYRKDIVSIPRKDWGWLSVFLIFTAGTQAPLFYAFNNMDIGSATLLFYVGMLLTMNVVGVLFLGEKLTKTKAFCILLAFAGMYIVFSFFLVYFTILAACMAVLNGIASGGEVSFSKKLTGEYSALYVTWLSWVIILVTNAPISVLIGEVQHLPSLDLVWLYQLGYTVASLIGFWFVIEALKYIEAGVGGLLGLLEIIFSILFGILLFSESLTVRVAIGAVLIIVAAALPNIQSLLLRSSA